MFIRILFLFVSFSGFIFKQESLLADPNDENKLNTPAKRSQAAQRTKNPQKKRAVGELKPLQEKGLPKPNFQECILPPAGETEEVASITPVSKEKQVWSPFRRKMSRRRYDTNGTRLPTESPVVRKFLKSVALDRFYRRSSFLGKTVFQADELFDPNALVLNSSGEWESNIKRMEKGCCPISYKGIVPSEAREVMIHKDIFRLQKAWRIELQHVTQRDSKENEDPNRNPICEMTHTGHMGKNARLILGFDITEKEPKVLFSSLTKEQAYSTLDTLDVSGNSDRFRVATNVLHFRLGGSLVDRNSFDKWRENYWKNRAKELSHSL